MTVYKRTPLGYTEFSTSPDDAARHCFVGDGFHATSMQDILTEANLSAGAVYRCFRSKDDIIALDALAEVASAFEEVLGRILATIQRLDDTQDLARVAVQVWGRRCALLPSPNA